MKSPSIGKLDSVSIHQLVRAVADFCCDRNWLLIPVNVQDPETQTGKDFTDTLLIGHSPLKFSHECVMPLEVMPMSR